MQQFATHLEKITKLSVVRRYNGIHEIFEKNAHILFMPFIERKLGFKIKSYEPLPSEMLWSSTESADFLCRITTENDTKSVLHVEFQVNDNHETAREITYYHNSISSIHKLAIQHVFFFLGEGDAPERMKSEHIKESEYNFNLLTINDMNTEELINSQIPEDILLALVSDRKEERKEIIVDKINHQIGIFMDSEDEFVQYSKLIMVASCL